MANYKITGVTVEVRSGIALTAEVSSLPELKQLLEDLHEEGLDGAAPADKSRRPLSNHSELSGEELPIDRLETRACLASGQLASAKELAFKDGSPQLLRPAAFSSVSDATLSLLYAVEIGLQKPSIHYDDFKDLYDAQNIKSGTALPMLLTNLRNAGYAERNLPFSTRY